MPCRMGTFAPSLLGIGWLFEHVHDAVIAADVESGTIVLWNPAAERLFGLEAGEAVGQPIEIIVPERFRDAHRQGLARYRRTGHGALIDKAAPIDIAGLHKDGHEVPVELTLSPISGPRGSGRFVIAIVRDIHDRVESDRLKSELIDRLQEVDRLKSQFLSVVSHELRTPLNAITGFGSILADEVTGPLTTRQHAYLDKILGAADALTELVSDLLDLARIQVDKAGLRLEAVGVAQSVQAAVEQLEPKATGRRISVVQDLPPDLPPIWADPRRIRQVLINLLDNAIKFSRPGTVVTVGAHVEGGNMRLVVADQGPGIAAADVAKLFKPFSQLDMSETRQVGGSGLGLAIVKAFVEAHGGQVGVETEPGRGSCFWVLLPIEPPAA